MMSYSGLHFNKQIWAILRCWIAWSKFTIVGIQGSTRNIYINSAHLWEVKTNSDAIGIKYPCKHRIGCKSSTLIYCITCKTCSKQYVGQAKNTVAQRFCSHFFNIRHNKQTDAVGLQFSRTGQKGLSDFSINILQYIHLPPPPNRALQLRLKVDKFWIHQRRCKAPSVLNLFY